MDPCQHDRHVQFQFTTTKSAPRRCHLSVNKLSWTNPGLTKIMELTINLRLRVINQVSFSRFRREPNVLAPLSRGPGHTLDGFRVPLGSL